MKRYYPQTIPDKKPSNLCGDLPLQIPVLGRLTSTENYLVKGSSRVHKWTIPKRTYDFASQPRECYSAKSENKTPDGRFSNLKDKDISQTSCRSCLLSNIMYL